MISQRELCCHHLFVLMIGPLVLLHASIGQFSENIYNIYIDTFCFVIKLPNELTCFCFYWHLYTSMGCSNITSIIGVPLNRWELANRPSFTTHLHRQARTWWRFRQPVSNESRNEKLCINVGKCRNIQLFCCKFTLISLLGYYLIIKLGFLVHDLWRSSDTHYTLTLFLLIQIIIPNHNFIPELQKATF